MKITILSAILFFAFLVNFSFVQASPFNYSKCKLEKSETLTVGCTKDCGRFNRWALKKFARKKGYKLKLVNLYSDYATPDLNSVDAIIIPGGADINPKYYISKVEKPLRDKITQLDYLVNYSSEGAKRDPFEYKVLMDYFKDQSLKTTPILGICRGMQLLAVSQGVPLYIDLKEELGIKNRKYNLDKIYVQSKDSEIFKIMGKNRFRGVEIHHQGPRVDYFKQHQDRWPNVKLTALSHKGKVAEAIEWTDRPVLGVQFHPEYTFGKVRRRIFSWVLNQACHNKVSRRSL
ncbi:MAG: gamma-glutamyl-gamma-aminobutyrate hydrolase family protein [Bacteriovoracaceae bacterium]|jgi:putative glutamine amidotransferase|nr:gamma-glutamyl-gamma-aminobutyrate hydrolase family protein [Bacteriovoracaceae bacterium]